jgi:hypothetical protein
MRYAIFSAVFGALLLALAAQGQSHLSCGTPSPKYAPVFDGQHAENSANPYVVQIFVHILRDDDGSNAAMSDAVLRTNLNRMAAFYRPHNICFTFVGRDFIDNTTWNSNFVTNQIGMLHAVNPHTDAIDIYVHRNNFQDTGGNVFGGNAYSIPSPFCSVAAPSSFNFEHEVGHCLGLLHTFETANGTECPDGSNCASAGDLVCDTDADFAGSQNSAFGCIYVGNQMINCNGADRTYDPPTDNIMSYWASCYAQFTNGQGARMRNTIDVTGFLQDRLTPDDVVIAGVTLTDEIAVGAQNSILIGNIAALGDVTMNADAHGVFNAGAFVQVVPGTQISPTGANSILLRINDLCNGLFFTAEDPIESRETPAQPPTASVSLEAYPNPFADKISIRASLEKSAPATLQIFDFSGRLVQNIDCQSLADTGKMMAELSVTGLHPGIYVLRLQYDGGLQTLKLLKSQSD